MLSCCWTDLALISSSVWSKQMQTKTENSTRLVIFKFADIVLTTLFWTPPPFPVHSNPRKIKLVFIYWPIKIKKFYSMFIQPYLLVYSLLFYTFRSITYFFIHWSSQNSKIIYLLVNSARLSLSLVNLFLWFCVVDAELEDSWNNLREILDERWLGDLSHKFLEEILRL